MRILLISGSPVAVSRSRILTEAARQWLNQQGAETRLINVSDINAQALIQAQFSHPEIRQVIDQVASADGIIVASPVYKAACTGVLKTLLDLLPERALENKVVLPLMTAGSHAHLLALDYSLKPVLGALKAEEIMSGVYACDSHIQYATSSHPSVIADDILNRLEQNLETFWQALQRRPARARRPLAEAAQ
ncbi:NADPH-dependent FMN reductase [Shimwellia blattae]|uniref:Sulfate starvation-induced protein 4 n=1 Tax=Shimwellia blattae (strain ATCC 29907 / DSM 4481 / JCM 1650 / NBRC 105725 / CDC 9005-74) TaxID=630626 RepID=I2BBW8_SHIBC|nr:NADPH-dependent FMN reductase [Shimwellia blattae]AFJ48022.1 sulfate starvation-induced protein 4 [Shimwellia blattae DSM 4481 = NBRC 105725]GAB81989.1 FMN reductase [Shimwellia blattae DSM 4481 = NBRC 105725]VDY65521.1 FMN reductase (NADPH) [Shimwellia blattae]VEC24838.1 FMN reductase (NADPH) [Shimwellia blattae]